MDWRRLAAPDEDNGEAPIAAWVAFLLYVSLLLVLEATCLQSPFGDARINFNAATKQAAFWIGSALLFDGFSWAYLDLDASVGFLQGCMLEYMLSFDNLFVFHLVFAYYCTPENLLYRALYFGIVGAIVLRCIFLVVGFTFMSSGVYVFKFIFGAVLVWSGVRTASDLDDDLTSDPTNNVLISWVTKNLPVSDTYEPHGYFFVEVIEAEEPQRSSGGVWDEEASDLAALRGRSDSLACAPLTGGSVAPGSLPRLESFEGSSLLGPGCEGGGSSASSLPGMDTNSRVRGPRATEAEWIRRPSTADGIDVHAVVRKPVRPKKKASLLLLVVVAVWAVDTVFAVDSVASKLAAVSDVFLNCSSSAFAMMGLRSCYFVMESLTQTFETLKYGISAVLILIGLKLVFSGWLEVSTGVSFAIILGVLASSIVSAHWLPRFSEECQAMSIGGAGPVDEANDEDDDEDSSPGLPSRGLDVARGGKSFALAPSAFERAPLDDASVE